MKKVFLGGTCNNSSWRDDLIKLLEIDYFNPVVVDWTEECMKEEIRQRELCDYCLYTITPRMTGVYSIAEVVDDSNKRPEKTILCILDKDKNPALDISTAFHIPQFIYFNSGQQRSLKQVANMIQNNGAKYFTSLEEVACYLNSSK